MVLTQISDFAMPDSKRPDAGTTDASVAAAHVVLDGRRMSVADVVALAEGGPAVPSVPAVPVLDPTAVARVESSRLAAAEVAAAGRVYGRSTGVGANRTVAVAAVDADSHGLRLLRSHAGAIGER